MITTLYPQSAGTQLPGFIPEGNPTNGPLEMEIPFNALPHSVCRTLPSPDPNCSSSQCSMCLSQRVLLTRGSNILISSNSYISAGILGRKHTTQFPVPIATSAIMFLSVLEAGSRSQLPFSNNFRLAPPYTSSLSVNPDLSSFMVKVRHTRSTLSTAQGPTQQDFSLAQSQLDNSIAQNRPAQSPRAGNLFGGGGFFYFYISFFGSSLVGVFFFFASYLLFVLFLFHSTGASRSLNKIHTHAHYR